jgi:hypothetical protein
MYVTQVKSAEERRKNRNFHNILDNRPQVHLTRSQQLRSKHVSQRLAAESAEEERKAQVQREKRSSLASASRELSEQVNRSEAERRAQVCVCLIASALL